MNKKISLLLASTLLLPMQISAQQKDVTFFVIGKHANYSQDESGDRTAIDYSFFSEIFLTAEGDGGNATLTFPTDEVVGFKDMREVDGGSKDNIFLYAGPDRLDTLAALQDRYPDGTYKVSFDTPSGSVESGQLTFENRGLPDAPAVGIFQDDGMNCANINPDADVTVSWGEFSKGRADPNGILDDLVFVILTDAYGMRVAHSGRPFEQRPYLTYADSSFTIEASVLVPNHTYELSVEHAILDDTVRFGGVPAFTTRAVTTKLMLTSGESGMTFCEMTE